MYKNKIVAGHCFGASGGKEIKNYYLLLTYILEDGDICLSAWVWLWAFVIILFIIFKILLHLFLWKSSRNLNFPLNKSSSDILWHLLWYYYPWTKQQKTNRHANVNKSIWRNAKFCLCACRNLCWVWCCNFPWFSILQSLNFVPIPLERLLKHKGRLITIIGCFFKNKVCTKNFSVKDKVLRRGDPPCIRNNFCLF